jgi:hypothetical protein
MRPLPSRDRQGAVARAIVGLCLLTLTANSLHAGATRIFYSKYFKGSTPEYTEIVLESSGQAAYREALDDDNPLKFRLAEADTRDIFALAAKLDHFKRPVESGLKVANLGMKTFRFEDGDAKTEMKFNYSLDPDAQALQGWFERIAETEQRFGDLDRTVHFDKLGVNDAILRLQITYDAKRLIAPEQFLPLLDRVSKNESFMHVARERAAELAETFRKLDKTQ